MSLANDLRELAAVAARIDEFCAARDLAPAIAYAINLSVDELLTNTISYGYDDDGEHRIDIALRMEGSVIVVEIADDARPFDPRRAPTPDTEASIEDRDIGGLGIFLVHQTMDGLGYRLSGGRNIVTLTKRTAADAGA